MSKSWNGGRPKGIDKELSRVQKMAHENKGLKEEIGRLRKTISRMDSGWCPGCLKKYEKDSQDLEDPDIQKSIKSERPCFKCGDGKLILVKYYKINEVWYFRGCDKCQHRTRGKRYTEEVKD